MDMIYDLLAVSWADGIFHESEIAQCKHLAELLSFKPEVIDFLAPNFEFGHPDPEVWEKASKDAHRYYIKA